MSFTRQQFATSVLELLGNINPAYWTMAFIVGWSAFETGVETAEYTGAKFNLLNTTEKWNSSTPFNSAGVQNYNSYNDGIAATVATLRNGNYPNLVDAFQTNHSAILQTPTPQILEELSTWCGGCDYAKGEDFSGIGQQHLGDSYSYGNATNVLAPPPPPPPTASTHQLKAAMDCWSSFLTGENTPPNGTGIFEAWLQELIAGRQWGPPMTKEYTSVDWSGNSITVQEFPRARCEWYNGAAHWET